MISLYQIVKNFDVIYNRFDVVPVSDSQTDGQTKILDQYRATRTIYAGRATCVRNEA